MAPADLGGNNDSPSIVIRAIWFIVVGWWLTGIVLGIAWLLNITIVGLPLGIKLINKAPFILSLKKMESNDRIDMTISGKSPSLLIRGIYFVLVGWWASGILMIFSYLVSLTIIGLPLAIKLFNYLPYVVSLKRF